jgi:beta-lactam-binding protein with PASTA domain
VPSVIGVNESQARRVVSQAGFDVVVHRQVAPERKGRVIDQDPDGGQERPPGATITVVVSKGWVSQIP